MNGTAEVLVVACDPAIEALSARLRAAGINAQTAGSYLDAHRCFLRAAPHVAVIDDDLPQEVTFPVYKLLRGSRDVTTLLLVSADKFHQFALDLHRSEFVEYAPRAVELDELVSRVKAMLSRTGYQFPPTPEPAPDDRNAAPDHTPDLGGLRRGRIVAVFGAKGGVGKSTIAVNLAVGLKRLCQHKTLLVDADLCFGNVGVLLNLSSSKSVFDLREARGMDLATLEQPLLQHESGIAVLLRPAHPVMVEKLGPGIVVKVLQSYRALFDYVIVDTHTSYDETTLQVLDAADQILVVVTPEMGTTHNTVDFLDIARTLGYLDKIVLVLNRANSGIDVDALEKTLRQPISGRVVSAGRLVVEVANEGTSLFAKDPDEEEQITQDLAQLVERVAGQPRSEAPKTEPKKKAATFGFLRRMAR